MNRTQTFVVDLRRLEAQGADGVLVIRLMRAADDIAVANQGLHRFSEEQPRIARHVQKGARRYFVRMQCGHLCEGLELIRDVGKSTSLSSLLPKCQPFAREAYQRLIEVSRGGRLADKFDRQIRKIRNRAAFHYDPSLVAKALSARAREPSLTKSNITRGTDIKLWRSGLADDIEDTIICRLLWKIPSSANLRVEADKILAFGDGLCRDFVDFTGELAFRYLRSVATV